MTPPVMGLPVLAHVMLGVGKPAASQVSTAAWNSVTILSSGTVVIVAGTRGRKVMVVKEKEEEEEEVEEDVKAVSSP